MSKFNWITKGGFLCVYDTQLRFLYFGIIIHLNNIFKTHLKKNFFTMNSKPEFGKKSFQLNR